MNDIPYKGFLIVPTPYQLADSGKWAMQVYIRHDTGNTVTDKPFSAGNTFETKEEATRHCLEFAKQIIDGQHSDCSVDDLL